MENYEEIMDFLFPAIMNISFPEDNISMDNMVYDDFDGDTFITLCKTLTDGNAEIQVNICVGSEYDRYVNICDNILYVKNSEGKNICIIEKNRLTK